MRAGLQEICWQQGAGGARRHWEAVAQLRGDAKCRHRAAANPKHNPWLHICMTMVLPPPPPPIARPCKASRLGHGLCPFSIVLLLQPQHPALHPGVPRTQQPQSPTGSSRSPNTLPSTPAQDHLPQGSLPQGGSPRGSHQQHPSRGRLTGGDWLQLCSRCCFAPLAHMLRGNHRLYLTWPF